MVVHVVLMHAVLVLTRLDAVLGRDLDVLDVFAVRGRRLGFLRLVPTSFSTSGGTTFDTCRDHDRWVCSVLTGAANCLRSPYAVVLPPGFQLHPSVQAAAVLRLVRLLPAALARCRAARPHPACRCGIKCCLCAIPISSINHVRHTAPYGANSVSKTNMALQSFTISVPTSPNSSFNVVRECAASPAR